MCIRDRVQATNRYTVSVEDLIEMAKVYFSPRNVNIRQVKYTHTNNRNSQGKSVIEYLILCGESKYNKPNYDIVKLKREIKKLKPTNRNPMYNTHLYWSQKAFNIINKLIKNLSEPGDVVFDPFMGCLLYTSEFSYDAVKVDEAIAETYKMDGIFYVKVWLSEGQLEVGDDIMYVLIGGDIRPHVVDALQFLVEKIKTECVTEIELRA